MNLPTWQFWVLFVSYNIPFGILGWYIGGLYNRLSRAESRIWLLCHCIETLCPEGQLTTEEIRKQLRLNLEYLEFISARKSE